MSFLDPDVEVNPAAIEVWVEEYPDVDDAELSEAAASILQRLDDGADVPLSSTSCKFTLSAGTVAVTILSISGSNVEFADVIVSSNGAGSNSGVSVRMVIVEQLVVSKVSRIVSNFTIIGGTTQMPGTAR